MSFVGIIPNFFSASESDIEKLATVPATKQEITKEEAIQGLLFKGPFVVHHYRYDEPLLAIDLSINNNNFTFLDGAKFFILQIEGNVVFKNESLIFKVRNNSGLQEVNVRGLKRSDPLELTGQDMPLNKFAKVKYAEYKS
jgi:hypothetical protein